MAVLNAQTMPVDGFLPSFAAADSAGDETVPGEGVFAVVKNGDSASHTVTFSIPVTVHGAVSVAKTVAAGDEVWVPLPVRNYHEHGSRSINQTATSNATWAYDAVTSVTVAVVKAL